MRWSVSFEFRQKFHTIRVALVCGFILTLATIGCGGSEDDLGRVAVSGTVSVDGSPLATGTLSFVPKGDGPACGAGVVDGVFEITHDKGPIPGEYDVRLTIQLAKLIRKPAESTTAPSYKPQQVTIPEDGGKLELQFRSKTTGN